MTTEAYIHEWGCSLAEAIQFTGAISSCTFTYQANPRSRYRHSGSRFQQFHLGSNVDLLRPQARDDFEFSHLRDIFHLEG